MSKDTKIVGAFCYDDGQISGPVEYMRAQGNAKIDNILSGGSVVANFGMMQSPDPVTAVLVALQTDYAAWEGMQTFNKGVR